nr:MAG TPA: hypothetical protein [Caudoviricetes sp.]
MKSAGSQSRIGIDTKCIGARTYGATALWVRLVSLLVEYIRKLRR